LSEIEKDVEVFDPIPYCEECHVLRRIMWLKRVFKAKNTWKTPGQLTCNAWNSCFAAF